MARDPLGMRTSSACGRPAPCWRAAHFAFVKKRREEEKRHAPKAKALTEAAPLEKQNDVMFDLFSRPTNLVILGFFRSAPATHPRETETRSRKNTEVPTTVFADPRERKKDVGDAMALAKLPSLVLPLYRKHAYASTLRL